MKAVVLTAYGHVNRLELKPGGTIGSVVGEPEGAKGRGFVVHGMMSHRRLPSIIPARSS